MAKRITAKMKKQQAKMKACAVQWNKKKKSGKKGSYRTFMKNCL